MNLLHRIRGDMETPRLLLRHWNPMDLEDFLSFAADPEVMLASGATPAVTPAQGETAFRRALWGQRVLCHRVEGNRPGHWKDQVSKGYPPVPGERPVHRLRAGKALLGQRLYAGSASGHDPVRF